MTYATAVRPNGKIYKARKPPVTVAFEGEYPDEAFIMVLRLGKGEREEAIRIAEEEARNSEVSIRGHGTFGWWRETMRNYEHYWDYDDIRGMPGWFFRVE